MAQRTVIFLHTLMPAFLCCHIHVCSRNQHLHYLASPPTYPLISKSCDKTCMTGRWHTCSIGSGHSTIWYIGWVRSARLQLGEKLVTARYVLAFNGPSNMYVFHRHWTLARILRPMCVCVCLCTYGPRLGECRTPLKWWKTVWMRPCHGILSHALGPHVALVHVNLLRSQLESCS